MEQKTIDLTKVATMKAAIKSAEKAMLTGKRDEILANKDKFDAAVTVLLEYENSFISKEQIAAQIAYDLALLDFNVAKEKLSQAVESLKKHGGKVKGTSSGDPAAHAPKMEYETVQAIRKQIADGVKHKDIMEMYGISSSAIGYYANYLQHKLKRGDTPHTPLVNKYYPLGAPYAEDNVKEGDDRYKVKTYTLADLKVEYKTAENKDDLARKYAMTVDKMKELIKAK